MRPYGDIPETNQRKTEGKKIVFALIHIPLGLYVCKQLTGFMRMRLFFFSEFCSRSSAPYGPQMCTTAFLQLEAVSQ